MRRKLTRRDMITGSAAAACVLVAPRRARAQSVTLNDASELNPTPVARHWIVKGAPKTDFIARLRAELKAAAAEGRPVAVSTARHSMGGQSLARDGVAVSLIDGTCEPNSQSRSYRATAGTRWRDVIATLDPLGFSPAVTQSNNDFGVSGTFSVNAHGWPVPYGPFGSTVRSIELMTADGAVVTCSRSENSELFRLALGGYGLLGVVLSADIEMVDNVLLAPSYDIIPSADFAPRFIAAAADPAARMMYGRLSVVREDFLGEALLTTYRPVDTSDPLPPPEFGSAAKSLARRVYRAQVGSDRGKRMRWWVETVLRPHASSNRATRNALLNTPVALLASNDSARVDILHEYFVPAERFGDFVALCREVIQVSRQELLNITLRYVAADDLSVLAYAPEPRIAGVMAFSQRKTPEDEREMRRLTQRLIDGVAALGGSFYLPYRLHARRDQVERIYANAGAFAAAKRTFDRKLIFRNALWDAYFA